MQEIHTLLDYSDLNEEEFVDQLLGIEPISSLNYTMNSVPPDLSKRVKSVSDVVVPD